MKSAVWMFALLAGLIAQAKADGVCYDPDHTPGKSEASVRADISLIRSKGFDSVRTYISKFGPTNMAEVIASTGIRVALGVPYPNGDYNDHLNNAVNAAKAHGNVQYIFVGNENLGNSVPGDMIDAIKRIKSQVPGVKVGTVQRVDTLQIPAVYNTLNGVCDIIGVNVHPYFTGGVNADSALGEAKKQWNNVKAHIPNLLLTETGWPSNGVNGVGVAGSLEGAQKYFNAYRASWGGGDKFYFQAFDQPHRPEPWEKTYGLWDANGNVKVAASGVAEATTPVPTTTAVKTETPKPTETKANETVAVNATSNSTDTGASKATETLITVDAGSTEAAAESETDANTDVAEEAGTTTSDKTSTDTTGERTAEEKVNSQSASAGTGVGGVLMMAMFGVGIVAAAGGFIYKARQKAAELDERESKGSLSITPGGACVL